MRISLYVLLVCILILLDPNGFFFFFFYILFSSQVLINGLQHIVTVNVKPKLQMVETFIKVSTKAYTKSYLIFTVLPNSFSYRFQTGLLPSRNWICALVPRPPCKLFPSQETSTVTTVITLPNSLDYINIIQVQQTKYFFLMQEYTRNQIVGLINLVASVKGWKRKTRLEILEKIEWACT